VLSTQQASALSALLGGMGCFSSNSCALKDYSAASTCESFGFPPLSCDGSGNVGQLYVVVVVVVVVVAVERCCIEN
jgi:hypothetical protein